MRIQLSGSKNDEGTRCVPSKAQLSKEPDRYQYQLLVVFHAEAEGHAGSDPV
jgi:hypothetical protein